MALRLPKLVLLLMGCALAAPAGATHSATHARVVGYATDWTADNPRTLDRIDTLIFAFARVENGQVLLPANAAPRLARLLALRQRKPSLSVLISVGGWKAGGFSEAAATAAGRAMFAQSAARLVAAQGGDGLDVDWEYPGHHESGIASSAADRANFTVLIEALRGALDQAAGTDRHYALTIAAADGSLVDGIDIAAVAPHLDWFNLMTYDFVNAMTPTTGHHAGLYRSRLATADERSVDDAVRQFRAAGVPPAKLFIGAAFYGREFDDVHPEHDGLYQSYGHYQGEHIWPQLQRDYLGDPGFEHHYDLQAEAPWLWNPRTRQFISYDDPQSIAAKGRYVKASHLGGIMYWQQASDPQGELVEAVWRGLQ